MFCRVGIGFMYSGALNSNHYGVLEIFILHVHTTIIIILLSIHTHVHTSSRTEPKLDQPFYGDVSE